MKYEFTLYNKVEQEVLRIFLLRVIVIVMEGSQSNTLLRRLRTTTTSIAAVYFFDCYLGRCRCPAETGPERAGGTFEIRLQHCRPRV